LLVDDRWKRHRFSVADLLMISSLIALLLALML